MSASSQWTCQKCAIEIKSSDEKCPRCAARPRNPPVGHTQVKTPLDSTAGGSKRDMASEEEARWVCDREGESGLCGTINVISRSHCSKCGGMRFYHPRLLTEKEEEAVPVKAPKVPCSEREGTPHDRSAPHSGGQSTSAARVDSADKPTPPRCSSRLATTNPKEAKGRLEPRIPVEEMSRKGSKAGAEKVKDSTESGAFAMAADLLQCSQDLQAPGFDSPVVDFPDEECRLVVVGKTGNGKSHTGNTIVGLPCFDYGPSFEGKTRACQSFSNLRFGVRVEVVDTPGLFDTRLSEEAIKTEIVKCLSLLAPGPHAILLVLRIGRYTPEEMQTMEKLDELFGVNLVQFLVIVFTNGDSLKKEGEGEKEGEEVALKRMLATSPPVLKKLISRVKNRYVVLDNRASEEVREVKVKALLQMIGRLLKDNGGQPYSSQLLSVAEECMQERERQIGEGLQDLQEGRGQQGSGSSSSSQFMLRDMARMDVTAESSRLLQDIKEKIAPFLSPALQVLVQILTKKLLERVLEANQSCCLQ